MFNTATNVRGYEWMKKETEELVDNHLDASERSAGGRCGTSEYAGPSIGRMSDDDNSDCELSHSVLIPMEWDQDALVRFIYLFSFLLLFVVCCHGVVDVFFLWLPTDRWIVVRCKY